jgi:hypothetical protein
MEHVPRAFSEPQSSRRYIACTCFVNDGFELLSTPPRQGDAQAHYLHFVIFCTQAIMMIVFYGQRFNLFTL